MTEQLQITRDSVCLADDFKGPLETTLEIHTDASLNEVLQSVVASSFLQFSGPITALSAGLPLARVYSDGQIEYLVNPSLPASKYLLDSLLEFRFR